MEKIENNKIENPTEAENQIKIYTAEEAERIRQEKSKIYELFIKLGRMESYDICLDIHSKFFGDLSIRERDCHILHHILSDSSGLDTGPNKEFIYDKRDREAEEALKEKLEELKVKN
ncbi:hypothetical protein KAS41_03050 [Candidatus Parcubacteria bacterium]|nr:hypothetical protein [Candidatus Parcubacteria bacterium]